MIELFLKALVFVYCPDKYIARKTCDEAVDDYLASLKRITDNFVVSKMIKNLFTGLYADENIIEFNQDLLMSYFLVMK